MDCVPTTTPTTAPERFDLSFLLNQAAYAFSAQLGHALGDLGLSVREFCVLMKAAEEERTQNAIAELAALDKTTMVSTLDSLERSGLAKRRVSTADRRARVVVVTPKGRRLLQHAHDRERELLDDSLGQLSPADRDRFVEVLTRLVGGPWASPSHTRSVRRRLAKPGQWSDTK
jgi:MarR family transcriptional regulator, transcriptional regulator for hemolysin